MNRLLARGLRALVLAAAVSGSLAGQQIHGPVFSWIEDPCTSVTVNWVEQRVESEVWRVGKPGFGYGDGDDATVLDNMPGAYTRVYLRTWVTLPEELPEGAELGLAIRYDDGFVAWLDGRELARRNVEGHGAGARVPRSHEAAEREWIPLARAQWSPGLHILAVEGHNEKLISTDFSLDPHLVIRDAAGETRVELLGANDPWEYLGGTDPSTGWNDPDLAEPRDDLPPRAWLREAAAGSWRAVEVVSERFGRSRDRAHHARLTGLRPDTVYELQVGAVLDPRAPLHRFRTAPREPDGPVRFVNGGDMYHERSLLDAMNRRAGLEDPLFALLGGDLAYGNGKDVARWYAWLDSWAELAVRSDGCSIPVVTAVGNHEIFGEAPMNAPWQERAPFYAALFPMPEDQPWYRLDFGDWLTLLVLDSRHAAPVVGEQTLWLRDQLEARDHGAHLFAAYHRPAFGTAKDPQTKVLEHWVPQFEVHGVDVVFEHDHHTYKRTHPIREGALHPDGVLYLGDGAWGVHLQEVPEPGTVWYLAHAESRRHLIRVELDGASRSFAAVDAEGIVFDRWPPSEPPAPTPPDG